MFVQSIKTAIALLVLLLLLGPGARKVRAESGDSAEAAKSYSRAYNLILDEKWSAAVEAMKDHYTRYPKSSTTDDARYWFCFASEKIGKPAEEACSCYKQFIDAYPQSNYADQARTNFIRVAH